MNYTNMKVDEGIFVTRLTTGDVAGQVSRVSSNSRGVNRRTRTGFQFCEGGGDLF